MFVLQDYATEQLEPTIFHLSPHKTNRRLLLRLPSTAHCALAQACKRQNIADAAIIDMAISYLIKGKVATRYRTSVAVAREITSFDRHHDFAEGRNYLLGKIHKGARIGAKHRGGKANGKLGARKRTVHRTEFVRKLAPKENVELEKP